MGVGAGDKPVEADSSDEGFCVLDGRGRKSAQEFGDFVDVGAAVALILSCGEKSHCLANVLLVNSANRAAGSNTVIAFYYDRDLVFKSPKDRKSTRLNSSHQIISYAVFCLKKKKKTM